MSTQRQLLDWKSLKEFGWPYSRAHTWRLMEAGKFPRCVKLNETRNSHPVWKLVDVLEHLKAKGIDLTDSAS